jgi:hypothetical protein
MPLAMKFSPLKQRLSVCLCLALLIVSPSTMQAQTAQVRGNSTGQSLRSFGTSGKAVYPFTEGAETEADLIRPRASHGVIPQIYLCNGLPAGPSLRQ